jgi:hypothetical protein
LKAVLGRLPILGATSLESDKAAQKASGLFAQAEQDQADAVDGASSAIGQVTQTQATARLGAFGKPKREVAVTATGADSETVKTTVADAGADAETVKTTVADAGADAETVKTTVADARADAETVKTTVADAGADAETVKTTVADAAADAETVKTTIIPAAGSPFSPAYFDTDDIETKNDDVEKAAPKSDAEEDKKAASGFKNQPGCIASGYIWDTSNGACS